MWHYCETGSGPPLILLHGIGMSHAAWNAVIPRLRLTRRAMAFDIAGNSLGGAMALGAGRRGLARTVVAISPIGLWERRPP